MNSFHFKKVNSLLTPLQVTTRELRLPLLILELLKDALVNRVMNRVTEAQILRQKEMLTKTRRII